MGIKNLNRYLLDNCSKTSIKKIHLKHFANKIVAIDTSIYLYRFLSDGRLLENMHRFISILKSYHITPVFIFDGKPPEEKRALLQKRRLDKRLAEKSFMLLQMELDSGQILDAGQKETTLHKMDMLKRQFIRVRNEDVRNVKELMDAYGVVHFESSGEADQLCAFLTTSGKAWGCMSDDMDMFLYGCSFVLRQVSLLSHTVMLYNTDSILTDLNMSRKEFCEIMVLSGTDYNTCEKTSLFETLRWYKEYCKHKPNMNEETTSWRFYNWLMNNTKYIVDYESLVETYEIFQLTNDVELEKWRNVEIIESPINVVDLQRIIGGREPTVPLRTLP